MNKKSSKKIIKNPSEIIFGILSGSGLMFLVSTFLAILTTYIPSLHNYFPILYTFFYLPILISTSILYTKERFRIIYLVSSLTLFVGYLFTEIFGIII